MPRAYREPNRRFAASVTGVYRLTSVPSGSRNWAARFPHGIIFGSCTTVDRAFQPRELGIDVIDLKLDDRAAIGGGFGASRAE